MIKVELRRGDGLHSGRVWLSSVVKNVQLALDHAGHSMKADGKFGDGTERIVKQFQNDNGIPPTGIADNSTWRQLDPHLTPTVVKHEQAIQELLASFRGDLDWVHMQEEYGRANECVAIEFNGRKGWNKIGERFPEYKSKLIIFRKEL